MTFNNPNKSNVFIKLFIYNTTLALLFLTISCERGPKEDLNVIAIDNEKTNIVVTTTHIRDLVQKITGNRFRIHSLMGPGVDPHIYKPTSRDILAITKADIVVFHGMMLEGKLSEVLSSGEKKGIFTFNATAGLPNEQIIFPDQGDGNIQYPDPHVWFDPKIWSTVAREFTKMISDFDPAGKNFYKKNLKLFTDEILLIENWATAQMKNIPQSNKKLVTSHDAFQYFGRAMGLEVIALQGVSTTTEAGLGDRASLVDLIKQQNIPAIFIESSVNPGAIEEIAKECKVTVGGELFSDALGSKDHSSVGPGGRLFTANTWSGMMVHNVSTIVKALRQKTL
ncbi:zinc ABC transporter substrate-binding protein [Opitutales bacterium]|nr:zinc ABC transporter substrate-binding protein [Opitutales bacterium]